MRGAAATCFLGGPGTSLCEKRSNCFCGFRWIHVPHPPPLSVILVVGLENRPRRVSWGVAGGYSFYRTLVVIEDSREARCVGGAVAWEGLKAVFPRNVRGHSQLVSGLNTRRLKISELSFFYCTSRI